MSLAEKPCASLEFNIMKILPFLHAALLASCISLVSCDKQKLLLREKERLEAEHAHYTAELQAVEQRLLSIGSQVAGAQVNLERQRVAAEKTAAALELEIGTLESKAQALRNAKSEFSPRVDAYKARHLR